jgi:SOS-response transcriptional repressor LexA
LPARTTGVPVLGTIAAGFPIDVFDEGTTEVLEVDELIKAIPPSGPPAHGDIYALQVQGDSMVEDGLLDGDYVLIAFGPTVAQEPLRWQSITQRTVGVERRRSSRSTSMKRRCV